MLIFLYGKDTYRLKQNLDKIIGEYKKKNTSSMSFSVLDAGDGTSREPLDKLEDILKTTTFFDEKRLVVIKSPFLKSKELTVLIKKWGLAEDKERIIVCIEEQNEAELNKKDKNFYAVLTVKPNIVKSFELLSGKQLESWVVKEITGYDKKIDSTAVRKLILCTGGDSWLLNQEINKLVNYKDASGGDIITTTDIDSLVTPKEDLNIFEVIDAIANKNQLRAAKLLYNHLESNADPYYIFSMIIYQFRNLLRVKDLIKNAVPYAIIIKKTGLNPYVVKKTYEQSRKFELNELKEEFAELASIDIKAKNGEIDITDGLYQFVFSL